MKKILISVLLIAFSLSLYAQLTEGSNLPLILITTESGQEIPNNPRVSATMKIISGNAGERNYPDDQDLAKIKYHGKIQIEVRGASSQILPKKQYGLNTVMADNVTNNNVSLLGMPAENDWVLNGLAFDPSLMRDYLSYTLYRRMGNYSPRQVYCEVIINGTYRGLYLLQEKIKPDGDRVDIARLDPFDNIFPDVTGGYIIKSDKISSEDPSAWKMATPIGTFTDMIHEYPKLSVSTTEQKNYIRSVFNDLEKKATNASINEGYPSVIDIPSFVDFILINELSSNVDAYQFSTFFHKDRQGKLRAGPVWDHNLTYSNDVFGNRSRINTWQFDNGDNVGPTFWKNLYTNSTFRCYLAKRWNELIQPGQPLHLSNIESLLDEAVITISEAVVRENQRWATIGNHTDQVDVIKNFLAARIPWMTTNLGTYTECSTISTLPLVINRIHYHPKSNTTFPDENDLEFVEIVNAGTEPVTLTGLYFSGVGFTYQFEPGAQIAGNSVIFLANNPTAFEEYYGFAPFGKFARNLSNRGMRLVLADAFGNIVDEVSYSDSPPWPPADGNGRYLKLKNTSLDNSLPINWTSVSDAFSASGMVVSTEQNEDTSIRVYPNPTSNLLLISTGEQIIRTIRLCDLQGMEVLTQTVNATEATLGLSTFTPGMYLLFVYTKDGIIQRKVIRK